VPRIALGQLNLTVGDLAGNVARMGEATAKATEAGADLICFPELAVTGYPPEDLVLRPEFVSDNLEALQELARKTATRCAVVTGFIDRSDAGGLFNAAAYLHRGAVETIYHKVNLPNFGVFDERRYFVPGDEGVSVDVDGTATGLSVCEDAWRDGLPFTRYAGLPIIVNINGSPYHRGKTSEREDVLRDRVRRSGSWIVYVNAVGGQDELVFDGGSLVMAPDGTVAQRATRFQEDLLIVNISQGVATTADPARKPWPTGDEDTYRAIVVGLGDYVRKNGFSEVVIGLSGGIDSALVATLAVDALGVGAVRGVTMPSMYSSPGSVKDAEDLAKRLGIRIDTIAITDVFDRFRFALAEVFAGTDEDVAEENLQARVRGNLLMAISNKFGSIVLATGNKSEYAVGYSTLYGDMAGGFAPLKDVPKSLVYALANWRNEQEGTPPIPEDTIAKPPSAELRPDQRDTDTLPPYDVLDPIIEAYVEEDLSVDEMVAAGMDRAMVRRVIHMVDGAEYKRRQAAPGVKITPRAFGRDRRMPITNGYPN
jgi:NAD+ synthase (glutamine-hydrolysing)